jgi:hypothetical protein
MRLRDQQAMAGKERPVVQKGERQVVFENRCRLNGPRHDAAKQTDTFHAAR